jgi:hypothetical protein
MRFHNTFLAIVTIILFISVFYWIDYLSNNGYIVLKMKEQFVNYIRESRDTTHTVNMPINTSYSCKNFCGPTARCSITGQQCAADIDCPGCMPYVPGIKNNKPSDVSPDNDAGKLTTEATPTYSPLTWTYQNYLRINTEKATKNPPTANLGVDTWTNKFDIGEDFYNQRYRPNGLQFMPEYPKITTNTGQFITDGPLPANF